KILVGGNYGGTMCYNGHSFQNNILRLNPDGTFDTSFNNTAWFSSSFGVSPIAVQPDGKIIVGGSMYVTSPGELWQDDDGNWYQNLIYHNRSVLRMNPDGSEDTSFNIGTGFL